MFKRPEVRRSLLLDTSRKRKISRKTRVRNKLLNIFARFSWLKGLHKFFRISFLLNIVFLGMTGFLLFAIFSPYYDLKKISVEQNNSVVPAEVIQNITSKFLGENMFFLKKSEIEDLLRKKFPEIIDISTQEEWPSEIKLKLEIADPKYNIFDEESANFATITAGGIIISNTGTAELPTIKILQNNKSLAKHSQFIKPQWLEKIDLATSFLRDEIKLPIREIRLLMKARELHFVTTGDGVIWIDLEQPIVQQLRKLILAEGKLKLYSKKFDHIDLRIPKQIFWKWQ